MKSAVCLKNFYFFRPNSGTCSRRPVNSGVVFGGFLGFFGKEKKGFRVQEKREICKNFRDFFEKYGKNMRKFIVASIPPGRGDQLMPLFEA